MANYELYWNTPDCKNVPKNMVVGGSFGKIEEARAYACKKIGSKPNKVIEIFNFHADGGIEEVGVVKIIGITIIWVDAKDRKFALRSNGSTVRL